MNSLRQYNNCQSIKDYIGLNFVSIDLSWLASSEFQYALFLLMNFGQLFHLLFIVLFDESIIFTTCCHCYAIIAAYVIALSSIFASTAKSID